MYFDLNVPVPFQQTAGTKKGKEKQTAPSSADIETLEAKVDLLVHCALHSDTSSHIVDPRLEVGYTVLAFTQTVHKKVDPKTHINVVEGVLGQLKPRPGIVFLKRLSIILDEDSEKGFGLVREPRSIQYSFLRTC